MIGSIGDRHHFHAEEVAARRASRFEKIDKDDDGTLSKEEIDDFVDKIKENTGLSLDQESFAAQLDKDGNGIVNLEEFTNRNEDNESRRPFDLPWRRPRMGFAERAFARLDKDNSGDISETELTNLVNRINERSGKDLDAAEMIANLDADGDGSLSRKEARGIREEIGPPPRRRPFMQRPDGHPFVPHKPETEPVDRYGRTPIQDEAGGLVPPTIELPI